tara:strand:- start:107 stop:712 length:606 start_codon:yes stop_codon:yes gene_type:complete
MRKRIILSSALVGLSCSITAEENTELGATALFSNMGLSISSIQSVNYGGLTFDANAPGGYLLLLASTGEVHDITSGYTPTGNGASAGIIRVISTMGEVIDISCDVSNAVLALAGNPSQTIPVYDANHFVPLTSSIGDGDSSRGGNCEGVGMSISASYTSAGTDDIYIGGFLLLPPGDQLQPGSYSTSHPGGSPILFTLTYQ